jgi:Protein of unknown function (DUF3828)
MISRSPHGRLGDGVTTTQKVPDHMTIHSPATTAVTRRQMARGGLLAFAAAWVLALGPGGEATAQTQAEPAATITAIYKQYQGKGDPKLPKGIHSARLQKLMAADEKRTPKGDMGRLGFDPFVNGQDWEIKKLVVTETERKGDRATVRATFVNIDEPQDIEFQLVRRQQRWLIDEMTSLRKPRWTLSEILSGAPDAYPDSQ